MRPFNEVLIESIEFGFGMILGILLAIFFVALIAIAFIFIFIYWIVFMVIWPPVKKNTIKILKEVGKAIEDSYTKL